ITSIVSQQAVTDPSDSNFNSDANQLLLYQQNVLSNIDPKFVSEGEFCVKPLGVASVCLDVSFGADGKAQGNSQAGQTLFGHDGSANSSAFELYMQVGNGATTENTVTDKQLTNVTISYKDADGTIETLHVYAYQLDANTIIGISEAPQDGGKVPTEGIETAAVAEANGGIPVFELHLDPQTGELTLVQYHQVDNQDPTDANDALDILTSDNQQLFHFRATDYDGDHVDAPLEVSIIDDAPSVSMCVSSDADVTLLTHDANTIGSAYDTSTADFSGVFHTNIHAGVDLPATTVQTYALGLSVAAGSDSGLSSDGQHIYLFDQNGTIVGSTSATPEGITGDNTVFSLSVDGNGVVTLTQYQQIDHAGPGDSSNYDSELATLGDNLVSLTSTVTVTDVDGDSATASKTIDLGGNVNFADDGPSVTVTLTEATEPDLLTHDAKTVNGGSETVTQDFSTLFNITHNYGADTPGNTVVSYGLTLLSGPTDSGLTSDGEHILLSISNGVVSGTTTPGGETVFTLSIDSNTGQVSLTQYHEIDHAGPGDSSNYDSQLASLAGNLVGVTATATATDYDGDTATDSQTVDLGGHVSFADDGPSVTVNFTNAIEPTLLTHDASTVNGGHETVTQDFSTLFNATPNYGADQPGHTTTTYALTLLSGPTDSGLTSGGQHIMLSLDTTTGIVSGTTSPGGVVVFTLSIDSNTGQASLTQYHELDHLPSDSASSDYSNQIISLAGGLIGITATATATDYDGDTATSSRTLDLGGHVSFADDGPQAVADVDSTVEGQIATGNVITGVDHAGGDANATDGVKDSAGADTPITVSNVTGQSTVSDGSGGFIVTGLYGTLTMSADGDYTYTANKNLNNANGVTDTFSYTIKDADGDTSTTTLTITVTDGEGPQINGPDNRPLALTVNEAALSDGSNPSSNDEFAHGHLTIKAGSDNVVSAAFSGDLTHLVVDVNGNSVQDLFWVRVSDTQIVGHIGSANGPAAIELDLVNANLPAAGDTGSVDVAVTLLDNLIDPTGNGAQTVSVGNIGVVVTDIDGDTATSPVTVKVIDDVPTANADENTLASGTPSVIGNVITAAGEDKASGADVKGADGASVSSVYGAVPIPVGVSGNSGTTVIGLYGTLTINADGSYTYNRYPTTPGGVDDVFHYTLKDGDGDTSTTTLTIHIGDGTPNVTEPSPNVLGSTEVLEAGLQPNGTLHDGTSNVAHGTITVNSVDGVLAINVGGVYVNLLIPALTAPIVTSEGTLQITSWNPATGALGYTYTLTHNTSGDNTTDSFAVVVTDIDGDTNPASSLVIAIVDDVPHANADSDTLASGTTSTGGNVITASGEDSATGADTKGADGAVVSSAHGTGVDTAVSSNTVIQGAYGSLTISADGSYTYTRDFTKGGGGHDDVFTYTL
ncbi:MAG TPA: DUF5801 repeats-in-toxin domain-containing protein, partial [Terriglobales bacterium]|nr:DUF5801 repeats-in-toxin domain-containing protein [Terriglobales bacterium]